MVLVLGGGMVFGLGRKAIGDERLIVAQIPDERMRLDELKLVLPDGRLEQVLELAQLPHCAGDLLFRGNGDHTKCGTNLVWPERVRIRRADLGTGRPASISALGVP